MSHEEFGLVQQRHLLRSSICGPVLQQMKCEGVIIGVVAGSAFPCIPRSRISSVGCVRIICVFRSVAGHLSLKFPSVLGFSDAT